MVDLIEAGYIDKPHGVTGEIKIEFDDFFISYILKIKTFFAYANGCPVPFFIEHSRSNAQTYVKLQDINNPEDAKSICHQTLYLDKSIMPASLLKKMEKEKIEKNIIGYNCIDLSSRQQFVIKDLEEFPGQLMATVIYEGAEKLIPLHHDWIKQVQHKKQELTLELPEGLLTL